MKNILLLTDFSENSINAIRYALQLFEKDVCKFYVLHVQSSSSYTSDDLISVGNESIYNAIVKKSKLQLTKIVKKLENEFHNKNFQYQIIVDYDSMTDSVNQIVNSKNIELLVMGTNGTTGAKEVVFGSNTINVIRKVNCPSLVIPENFEFKKPDEVLLPLDLFDSLSSKGFINVLEFVNRFSKTLHMLRIKPQNEASKEEGKDWEHIDYLLKDMAYKYHIVSNIPMDYAVSCYSQTNNIDLITLLVQKESIFERFFIGSPTTQISNIIKVPLLIYHT